MINVTLENNTIKQFKKNTTGIEIIQSINPFKLKISLAVCINGILTDLRLPIKNDCTFQIITINNYQSLEIIRHDAAHITAQAVKELFPNVKIINGPIIENGFYYDFDTHTPFNNTDLSKIYNKMQSIVNQNYDIIRESWNHDKAIEFFQSIKEYHKINILSKIPTDQEIIVYKQGNFIDLCQGPHSLSTGNIKYFKLISTSGISKKNNITGNIIQRIYGTAWTTKEELDNYLHTIDTLKKRDHRYIGKELDLFHFQNEAQGMVFWHPKGWSIYSTIKEYIRKKIIKNGYQEVKTPILINKNLWDKSGHWEKFKKNMFIINSDSTINALKPMNCPCHIEIFKHTIKSYRDLPIRISEFGICHRNEASGSLHGLMRVRSLTQDDAHIFCTEEQISNETIKFCTLLYEIYKDFGFNNINIKFSNRPINRVGNDEIWDKAESALKDAIKTAGYSYTLNEGDGAFYGPKLEFCLQDSINRTWQCGTLQVDFILPKLLNAYYIDVNGQKKNPVILHRAIIGSFERFIGILIENYNGYFPIWLAPIQIAIATINTNLHEYATYINKILIDCDIRTEINTLFETINYKIQYFSKKKNTINSCNR